MRNKITKKVNGEEYIIGYTCMMAPTHTREKTKVFKMFQVYSTQDVHFFECINDKWILIPDYSFVNLEGNERLLDTYMNLPRIESIEFATFERLIFYCLYD